jgi:DNA-binding NarL/FixJ family response regulator
VTAGRAMRVVVAEDAAVLRDGLVRLLAERGHEVVAAVGDAPALAAAVAEHRPDVAIIDIRLPPTHTDDGLRTAVTLRRTYADLGILIFSQYVETRYASRLLASGARGVGYLLKERVAATRDFVDAVVVVGTGGTVLDPEVVSQLLAARQRDDQLATLTGREREVLELMAQGRSNTGIARSLVLSQGSVEKHVTNIFTKLGLPPATDDHRRVLAVLRYLES